MPIDPLLCAIREVTVEEDSAEAEVASAVEEDTIVEAAGASAAEEVTKVVTPEASVAVVVDTDKILAGVSDLNYTLNALGFVREWD